MSNNLRKLVSPKFVRRLTYCEPDAQLHRPSPLLSRLADERADREELSCDLGERSWNDLLAHRRVLVLAEAGSGKTKEFGHRARRLIEAADQPTNGRW